MKIQAFMQISFSFVIINKSIEFLNQVKTETVCVCLRARARVCVFKQNMKAIVNLQDFSFLM